MRLFRPYQLRMGLAFTTLAMLYCTLVPEIAGAQRAIVAGAANAQFAVGDIVAAFEAETDYELDLVVGSSGKLTAQIKNGAPFDIFLSADLGYPEALIRSGFGQQVRVYALGSLVMATARDLPLAEGTGILRQPRIRKIAIADPRMAPYGSQTINIMRHDGVYEAVKKKLVYGKNITQTSQYILSGSVDIGFTAKAMVMGAKVRNNLTWVDIDPSAYEPIKQGAMILPHGHENNSALTAAFFSFLFSEAAGKILVKHGYRRP